MKREKKKRFKGGNSEDELRVEVIIIINKHYLYLRKKNQENEFTLFIITRLKINTV